MVYPIRLYPQKEFNKINSPDPEHILCRWTNPDIELIGEDNKLNAEAIPDERIPGFSLNKIPASTVEDCYIEFNSRELADKYSLEWNKGDANAIVGDSDFKINIERGYFLFKIKDIHMFQNYYPFPGDAANSDFLFKVFVTHKPTVSNFFHFELEVFDCREKKIVKNAKGGWRKIITQAIKREICRNAKFNLNDFD